MELDQIALSPMPQLLPSYSHFFHFLTFVLCTTILLVFLSIFLIVFVFSEHGQPLSKNALKKLEKEKLKKERAEKDALARAAQAAAKASATVVCSSYPQ